MQIKTIAAHQLITAERILDASLFEYMHPFENHCIVCRVHSGTMKRHTISRCPIMAQRCFQCFGNHMVKDCLENPVILHGVCRSTFLPNRIGDTIFHRSGFMTKCQHKEILKCFALAALHFSIILEARKSSIEF